MPTTYITRLEVDINGARKSIKQVETSLDAFKKKAANTDGAKGGSFFGGLEKQADTLDNLFGKLGGTSLAVADTFKVLRTALIGSGIGAIVVLVGELINNFDTLKGAIDGVSSEQEAMALSAAKAADASIAQLNAVTETENILKLQGASEEEILELKIKQVDAAIVEQEIRVNAQKQNLEAQIAAEKRNKEALKQALQIVTLPVQALLAGIDAIGKQFGQDFGLQGKFNEVVSGFFFDPKAVEEEGTAALKEQEKVLASLQNQRAGFLLAQRKGAADAAKARQDELNAELDAMRKANEALNKAIVAANKAIVDAIKKNGQDVSAELLKQSDFDKLKQQEDLKLQLLKDSAEKEIALVDQKYIKLRDQAKGNAELEKELAEANQRDVDAINQKYAEQEIARQRKVQETRIQLTAGVFTALADLNSSFVAKNEKQAKRQFEINKGLQIAQALIQTYQSATAAFGSQFIPGDPSSLPRAIVAASVAVLSGLAQVNKIRQTKFDGGGASSAGGGAPSVGGSSGGNASGPPAFNPVNTDFINNRPPQPILAYTLAGNVSSAQEAEQKVKDQARL